MPPRKRARVSAATTPLQETQPKAPSVPIREKSASATVDLQNDPWTDEEEAMLFKSLVRWKPTGMHKHFRMLAIFESFRSNGFGSGKKEPPQHIRIPGIWRKLKQLYDLETLDERENAHAGFTTSTSTPDSSSASTPEPPSDFSLPEDVEDPEIDFGDLMWERRFAKNAKESPELIDGLNTTRSEPGVVLSGKDAEDDATSVAEDESTASPVGKGGTSKAKKAARPAVSRRTTRKR